MAQTKEYKKLEFKEKRFQLSFFPGISSNGLSSGHFFNKYSINLFGGISAGNHYFELGGISNLNTISAGGLQIAGLANVIGSNSFLNLTLKERRAVIKEGFSSDFKGIQFSGLMNFVRNNVQGIQLTGGFNVNNGNAFVLQFAGIGNTVAGGHSGIQVAGLYNTTIKGSGSQFALLFNNTGGSLSGIQIALLNKSKQLLGKSVESKSNGKSLQLGLINITKKTRGTQIGLINIASQAKGTQVGLINIFRASPYRGEVGKNNNPIGLINLGSPKRSHIRLSTNELFLTTIELTTGSCHNCSGTTTQMPIEGGYKVMNLNALIFSYNPFSEYNSAFTWGAGYGYQKVLYKKISVAPTKFSTHLKKGNENHFFSIGIQGLHLNSQKKFQRELSFLSKVHLDYGKRSRFFYWFAGLSLNSYFHKNQNVDHWALELYSGSASTFNYQIWLGYTVGLHIRLVSPYSN